MFNKKKIKAFAVDLDGTLLSQDSVLTERTVSVIKECTKKGFQIIISSGRSVLAAEKFRDELGIIGPMVYFNGAEVVDMPSGTILQHEFLANKIALECAQISKEYNVPFHVFFSDETDSSFELLMSANPKEAAELAAGKPDSYLKLGNIYDTLNVEDPPNCVKGLFIAAPDKLEDMRIVLSKRFKNKINIVKSAETFLEILNVKASKGNGLKHAMKMRNIKADEIIVFGDEENDLSMFKVAGFSCTPSNAKPRIKEEAKLVIASNAENGVAEFLAQNFL